MGSCHPNGSLYEKPLDLRAAQLEHMRFREELERNGCVVRTVREILAQDCDVDVVAREKLEDLAMDSMAYKLIQSHGGLDLQTLTSTEAHLLSDEYKKSCIEKMDVEQLVEVILTRPTILLEKADKDTELLVVNYTYEPLVNLIFCRDQQITTARGVVMGRPRSRIRQREVEVMKFCFEKLGVPIIGNVTAPGTLEGGDFFPAGMDLCMVGVGLRSNMEAVRYLLDNDLFGTERVAVVKDYFDQHQQRMHLDTVFNIIGPKVCIMLKDIQGKQSPLRRLVDEYRRDATGKYFVARHDIEFLEYVEAEGYHVITLSNDMQIAYGCNGLNLGNNTLVTVDRMTAKFIARTPGFSGKIKVVDFSNNTNMFGSVHCCSQVISRRLPTPAELAQKKPMVPPSPPRIVVGAEHTPAIAIPVASLPDNVPRELMMIAPNNFDVNQKTAQDNLLMVASHERFISKLQQKGQGRRDVHAALVSEFAELHHVLTVKIGASVHLFTHELFHQTPEAMFVADWFVTHRAEHGTFPSKGQNGLVLLPMKADTRQKERRPDLVHFLSEKYSDIVNLEACETGHVAPTKTATVPSSPGAIGPCKPLEGSSFVMDRRTRTAFAARTATRLDLDSFQAWAKETGYSTILFNLNVDAKLPNVSLLRCTHHTRILLSIFSNFTFVCGEAIAPGDRPRVMECLARNGQTIFDFTLAQVAALAITGSFEVFSREGKSTLIVSQSAFASFTQEQKRDMLACGTTFEVVNMTETEQLGGGSVSGVIGSLY